MYKIEEQRVIGKMHTLLVQGCGEHATAIVCGIHSVLKHNGPALAITGPGKIDSATQGHYAETLIPILQQTAKVLGIPQPKFELTLSNVGAAAVQDRPIELTGYSADASVLMACLSALLNIPCRPAVAITGHIASPQGDVRMVAGLPAKMEAAHRNNSIHTMVYPDLDADDSLGVLTPREHCQINEALIAAKEWMLLVSVKHINDLVSVCFDESDLIIASLDLGYFREDDAHHPFPIPMSALIMNLAQRFWKCLEITLNNEGTLENARALLASRIRFHVRLGLYPQNFGYHLFNLLASIPRPFREFRLPFPLLPNEDTIEIIKLTQKENIEDMRQFLDAIAGDHFPTIMPVETPLNSSVNNTTGNKHLELLLDELDADRLRKRINPPIDDARNTFLPGQSVVRTPQECLGTVLAFYRHLLRHTSHLSEDLDEEALQADAQILLERTFSRQGGYEAAIAESLSGTRGGMRYILDSITEFLKSELREKYANRIFKRLLNDLDYDERVALVKSFMDILSPYLSDESCLSPPDAYVDHAEELIRAYMSFIDHIRQRMRAM